MMRHAVLSGLVEEALEHVHDELHRRVVHGLHTAAVASNFRVRYLRIDRYDDDADAEQQDLTDLPYKQCVRRGDMQPRA